MSVWETIAKALRPSAEDEAWSAKAISKYLEEGSLSETNTAMLRDVTDAAIAVFFRELSYKKSAASPVAGEADSSWMAGADFCYFDIHAAGAGPGNGGFLSASKLLPVIPASALKLAPFHPFQFDVLEAVESRSMVSSALCDPRLTLAGLGPDEQLRAFIEAAGLTGKTLGYSLSPRFAQFARTVLSEPGLFRWIALDQARKGLAYGLSEDSVYEADCQAAIASSVQALVEAVKRDFGIVSFEYGSEADRPLRALTDKAYYAAIRSLMEAGLWPVLEQAKIGVGIPAFDGYDEAGGYPEFSYRSESGEDASSYAFPVVTPVAFYDGLPPNRMPSSALKPEPRPGAAERFAGFALRWAKDFGFGFVSFGSAERLLDSIWLDGPDLPVSDRPTPGLVRSVMERLRSEASPSIGALAERFEEGPEGLGALGIDLSLGQEIASRIDRPLMERLFIVHDEAFALRASGGKAWPPCFVVDAPESGDPRLWGGSLPSIMGPGRMLLRRFAARFLSCGAARRPVYDTMGTRDLSGGLYESAMAGKLMELADDAYYTGEQDALEARYRAFRPFLDSARIVARECRDGLAWWAMRTPSKARTLIAVASLETAEGDDQEGIEIGLAGIFGQDELEGRIYAFPRDPASPDGAYVYANGVLAIDRLPFLSCLVCDLDRVMY